MGPGDRKSGRWRGQWGERPQVGLLLWCRVLKPETVEEGISLQRPFYEDAYCIVGPSDDLEPGSAAGFVSLEGVSSSREADYMNRRCRGMGMPVIPHLVFLPAPLCVVSSLGTSLVCVRSPVVSTVPCSLASTVVIEEYSYCLAESGFKATKLNLGMPPSGPGCFPNDRLPCHC